MESEKPDDDQEIHTYAETSKDEATLEEVMGYRNLPEDSVGSFTEVSASSLKFRVTPTDSSSKHKDLDDTEGTLSQSIFKENSISITPINTSKPLILPSENGSEVSGDQLGGTFSENHSKSFTNIYRDFPISLERRTVNATTKNFPNHSEVPGRGEYGMFGDQPTYLSAEIYNPYPPVATENAYIIVRDMVSNPSVQPDLSSGTSGNSTDVSSVQSARDMSEDFSANPNKYSTEEANEVFETSTEKMFIQTTGESPTRTREHLLTKKTRNETDGLGRWNDKIKVSSRSTRDNSGSSDRRTETSKGVAPRNTSDAVQFSYVTAGTPSSGQTTKRLWHRNTKIPIPREISSSTENGSRNVAGQLISIRVQNSPESSRISTENASKTSSDSTRNYFSTIQGTSTPPGVNGVNRDTSAGE